MKKIDGLGSIFYELPCLKCLITSKRFEVWRRNRIGQTIINKTFKSSPWLILRFKYLSRTCAYTIQYT